MSLETKLCRVCRERKPISEFHKRKAYKDGYDTRCKICELEYDRKRMQNCCVITTGSKTCSVCNKEKTVDQFYKRLRSKDGLCQACKECYNDREQSYYRKRPNEERFRKVREKYGLDADSYLELLSKQDYKCAICGIITKLCVDHCHITNKVRGLLCANCNAGLGMFVDDVLRLENAINYLQE